MRRFSGAIAVFVGAASFGILSTFVKKAYAEGFSLGEVTGVQALFGMLILWALYLIVYGLKLDSTSYQKKSKKSSILLAGVSTGIVSLLYYKCVELVPASIAIVLLMQFVWISALIDIIVFRHRPSKKQIIGIFLILIATVFATGMLEDSIQHINLLGIGYGLLAATAYAIFIIVNGKVGNDYPPLQKSALMVTGACIFIFVTLHPFHLLTLHVNPAIFHFGWLLSIFGTVIPPLLYAYGMPKIGVSLGSILSAVELPVAVSMSYFVLLEPVSYMQWFGVAFILATILWINFKNKK